MISVKLTNIYKILIVSIFPFKSKQIFSIINEKNLNDPFFNFKIIVFNTYRLLIFIINLF